MLRSIPCHTTDELAKLLAGDKLSLAELAPYGPEAQADTIRHMQMVENELARRATE